MTAPTLHTERLVLRPHRISDLDDCVTLWQDEVVIRHTSGRAFPRAEVWTRMLRYPGHWALLGYGYWAVEHRESGRFVGEVGFADWRRELLQDRPDLTGMPEAGWVTLPWTHGQGLAHEAMQAALAWRDSHLPDQDTFCLIHSDNHASLRLAEKLRFNPAGTTDDGTLILLRLAVRNAMQRR